MTNKPRVVSLFDGISCGRFALEQAGYAASYYAAYEIDKYARAISRYNYPDIERHGDVMEADFAKFTNIDLLIGGSPCQTFSIAKNGRDTGKGGVGWVLFMKYAEALKTINPRYFVFENVASMHKNIREYITEELGCEPILINSALVSAQQRKRLYWTNIKGVTQPKDRGILLQDILETGVTPRDKALCIDACYYKGGNLTSPEKQSGKRLMVYEPIALADKSQTILSTLHKENALSMVKRRKTGLFVAHNICVPIRIGTVGKGGQGNRIYSVKGKTVSLSANSGGLGSKTGLYKINLPDGDYVVRKLTPIEAERCQGLPDNFTALGIDAQGRTVNISNTQRYKCLGNGFQCDTVAHIFSFMNFKKDEEHK